MKRNVLIMVCAFLLLVGGLTVLQGCGLGEPNAEFDSAQRGSGMPATFFRSIRVQDQAAFNGWVIVAGPTVMATDVPAVIIGNDGLGRPLEIRNASGTPVVQFGSDGAATFAGAITSSGAVNGGGVLGAQFAVAPTAVATNTPVFYMNSATGNTANLTEWRIANTPVAQIGAAGNASFPGMVSTGPSNVTAGGATATPVFYVNGSAATNNLFEVRKAATPVFAVGNDGTLSNIGAVSDELIVSNVAKVAGPTAITTATPAFVIDSTAADSVLFDVRKAATPVFTIGNAGAFTATGAGTYSSGQTINNWTKVSAPTAIASATPALVVDSAGVSNVFEVRKDATPVFSVGGTGILTSASGGPLMYGTANRKIVASTDTITGTLAITHGLSAVAAAGCSMNAAPAAAAAFCSVAWTGTTVTVSVWKSDITTPGDVGAKINWYVIGTP